MTYGAFTQDFAPYAYGGRSRTSFAQIGFCVAALGVSTSVGIWALRTHTASPMTEAAAIPQAPAVSPPATSRAPAIKTASGAPAAVTALRKAASAARPAVQKLDGLLDPNLTSRFAAVVFARNAPLRAGLEPHAPQAPVPAAPVEVAVAPQVVPPLLQVAPDDAPLPQSVPQVVPDDAVAPSADVSPLVKEVPLPQRRPADLAPSKVALAPMPGSRGAPEEAPPAAVPAAPGKPSFFQKLFGQSEERGPALAYAAPEDSVIGNIFSNTTGRPAPVDRYTAVYNITTHTVTLPDGTRLEAHSGLGAAKDNPRMVTQRMVGATPPNVYELTVREAPFHGVRALRLTPTGGTTFGRAGLLAHTYMLRGRSGESNGCVVFRDYQAFLRAYDSGAVRRLAVVSGA